MVKTFLPRWRVSLTTVSSGPLSAFIISSEVSESRRKLVVSARRMRSPAWRPARSLGPPSMTRTTTTVSSSVLNWMPIPAKEPSKVSVEALFSSALR